LFCSLVIIGAACSGKSGSSASDADSAASTAHDTHATPANEAGGDSSGANDSGATDTGAEASSDVTIDQIQEAEVAFGTLGDAETAALTGGCNLAGDAASTEASAIDAASSEAPATDAAIDALNDGDAGSTVSCTMSADGNQIYYTFDSFQDAGTGYTLTGVNTNMAPTAMSNTIQSQTANVTLTGGQVTSITIQESTTDDWTTCTGTLVFHFNDGTSWSCDCSDPTCP
jgi:hypothetical protein